MDVRFKNKEFQQARVDTNHNDVITVLSFLHERNLFTVDKTLPNIETGVTAVSDVNAHCTHTVDHNILEPITRTDSFTISFKRSMKVAMNNE